MCLPPCPLHSRCLNAILPLLLHCQPLKDYFLLSSRYPPAPLPGTPVPDPDLHPIAEPFASLLGRHWSDTAGPIDAVDLRDALLLRLKPGLAHEQHKCSELLTLLLAGLDGDLHSTSDTSIIFDTFGMLSAPCANLRCSQPAQPAFHMLHVTVDGHDSVQLAVVAHLAIQWQCLAPGCHAHNNNHQPTTTTTLIDNDNEQAVQQTSLLTAPNHLLVDIRRAAATSRPFFHIDDDLLLPIVGQQIPYRLIGVCSYSCSSSSSGSSNSHSNIGSTFVQHTDGRWYQHDNDRVRALQLQDEVDVLLADPQLLCYELASQHANTRARAWAAAAEKERVKWEAAGRPCAKRLACPSDWDWDQFTELFASSTSSSTSSSTTSPPSRQTSALSSASSGAAAPPHTPPSPSPRVFPPSPPTPLRPSPRLSSSRPSPLPPSHLSAPLRRALADKTNTSLHAVRHPATPRSGVTGIENPETGQQVLPQRSGAGFPTSAPSPPSRTSSTQLARARLLR